MSMRGEERPVDLPEAIEEEDIDPADAADRLDADPEEQPNAPDQPLAERSIPEDR